MTYSCIRKCVNDFHKPELAPTEKICLNRCAFKYIDALHYGNRAINLFLKKTTEENNRTDETPFSFAANN